MRSPKAVQVADRWHLLNNLLETLMRSLERHRHTMTEVARQIVPESAAASSVEEYDPASTAAAQRTQQKREHRLRIYQDLMRMLEAGTSQSEASRQLGVSLRTVQRWLSYGVFPERKHRVFPNSVNACGPHLDKRYGEGCRNITVLWKELQERGFEGGSLAVRTWLRRRFGSPKKIRTGPLRKRSIPIGHQRIAWLMLKADPLKNSYLKALYRASPEISEIAHTARGLFEIIRKRDAAAWPAWLEAAERSPYAGFARHPEGSGRRRRGVATTLEQRDGRGTDPSIEAPQATDVRPRRLRSAQTPRTQPGLSLRPERSRDLASSLHQK